MKTIVMASMKGGSGKSTLAVNLAVNAEKNGAGPVALVDMDSPQGSASSWWNAREAETPLFADGLNPDGVELVVVDTPPQKPAQQTIRAADLVLIPVRPSPNDLRAVGQTLEVVEKVRKPFIFIINSAKNRTRIAMDTLQTLAQFGRVAPVMIGDRIDLAESMIGGLAVSEYAPSSRSADELTKLWTYVSEQLRKT